MNKIFSYFSQYFGQKDISQYPELYHRPGKKNNPYHDIFMSSMRLFYDSPQDHRSVDWRHI